MRGARIVRGDLHNIALEFEGRTGPVSGGKLAIPAVNRGGGGCADRGCSPGKVLRVLAARSG